jgi:hypothetical protein
MSTKQKIAVVSRLLTLSEAVNLSALIRPFESERGKDVFTYKSFDAFFRDFSSWHSELTLPLGAALRAATPTFISKPRANNTLARYRLVTPVSYCGFVAFAAAVRHNSTTGVPYVGLVIWSRPFPLRTVFPKVSEIWAEKLSGPQEPIYSVRNLYGTESENELSAIGDRMVNALLQFL